MNSTYTYPKIKYDKDEVEKMYVFFDNGDYFSIDNKEIISISITNYDKLVYHCKGYSPLVESGCIELKICDRIKSYESDQLLYNLKEYKRDRKSYIENRCVFESRITSVWLFYENNWTRILLGNIVAKMEVDLLIINFLPQAMLQGCSGSEHHIDLVNVNVSSVRFIDIDFENCEGFCVYKDEIQEINISFSRELEWNSSDLCRKISSGYLKLKLNPDFEPRNNHMFGKNIKTKGFEKRLCGNKGKSIHDICHLYVTYDCYREECLGIDDIKSDEEINQLTKMEDETGQACYCFEGGYCKKLKDGSIIVAFGKNSEETVTKLDTK
jgi:hypothetical protein